MKNLVNTFFRENFLLTGDTKVEYWSYSMSPDLLFEILRNRPTAAHWPAFHQKKNIKLFGKYYLKLFKIELLTQKCLWTLFWFILHHWRAWFILKSCFLVSAWAQITEFHWKKSPKFDWARENHLLFCRILLFELT